MGRKTLTKRDRDDGLRTLACLVERIGIAMLVTRTPEGRSVSRPVATAGFEGGTLWFFASAASDKVAQVKADPRVNLAYASPALNSYVSISGHARVRRDRRRIRALWTAAQRVYFPGGPEDPDLTLIHVQVQTAEYWDGPATRVGQALRFVLAAATGNADRTGDNRTLRVQEDGHAARTVRGNTRGDAGRVQRKPAAARKPSRVR